MQNEKEIFWQTVLKYYIGERLFFIYILINYFSDQKYISVRNTMINIDDITHDLFLIFLDDVLNMAFQKTENINDCFILFLNYIMQKRNIIKIITINNIK